jgi:hypothetical protein
VKDTQEWFKTHGVYVEDWPAHSPDSKPIEPVWRWLKVKLFAFFRGLLAWEGRRQTGIILNNAWWKLGRH